MKLINSMKIVLVPYPAQGHVTPLAKLGYALVECGFEAVIVTPEFIHRKIASTLDSIPKITCISISDGLEKPDFFGIQKVVEHYLPNQLESIIRKIEKEDGHVVCMIVDLLASSAIEIGHRCNVPVAGFWPAMLSTYHLIASIPDMLTMELISDTGSWRHPGKIRFLPNQPLLSSDDLPWLIGNPSERKERFNFWKTTMHRSRNLRWLLVNSFEDHQNSWDYNYKPLIYQMVSNKLLRSSKNPSFWEEDMTCLQWLDHQNPNSVLYISFGSWVGPIGESKITSLALALEAINQPFIWVLGEAWREGLGLGFIERVTTLYSKQAKFIKWAPQLQILQHKSVGCFLTHCGWNSTMEAIQSQKRLLCYPVAGDQFLNCAYIVEKWKIGIRIDGFQREDVEEGLRKVMNDNEINKRLIKLYERTMGEEAHSKAMANLNTFLHHLINLK